MDPLIAAANVERDKLTRELELLTNRLKELDLFLRVAGTIKVQSDSSPPSDTGLGTLLRAKIAEGTSIKTQVLENCARLLSDGQHIHTRDLVDALLSQGIELKGSDKLLQVSAILSRAKGVFVADRKRGWSLRKATKGEGSDVGASEPSDSRQFAA